MYIYFSVCMCVRVCVCVCNLALNNLRGLIYHKMQPNYIICLLLIYITKKYIYIKKNKHMSVSVFVGV